MKLNLILALILGSLSLSASGETGKASWYGPGFEGKPTANREAFNSLKLTAAHKTLKLGTSVKVTNLDNGKVLVLRVNDRGPFKPGRILDVSTAAAVLLGFKVQGIANVKVEAVAK